MKNAFDKIVGPGGTWTRTEKDPIAINDGNPLNAREDFALRCLNAAANLYGVIGMDDFVEIYNRYAKDHGAPVSDKMTLEELDALVDRLQNIPEPEDSTELDILNRPEVWFATWSAGEDTPRVIVYSNLVQSDDAFDGTPRTPEERKKPNEEKDERIKRRLVETVSSFKTNDLKFLPEDEFLEYEEPMYGGEDTDSTNRLAELIEDRYGIEMDSAELDVWGIQSHVRVNGPKIVSALEFIRDNCDWQPQDGKELAELVTALGPVVGETRTWQFRGRTQQEAFRDGIVDQYEREDIYDVFGLADDGYIQPNDIPLSVYNGPIDFKFVKDAERRDAKLAIYEDVRQVTREFVRDRVIAKMTQKARHAAAVRLGFLTKGQKLEKLDPTLDCVVGDFASMMDDQDGEPMIKRVLKDVESLDAIDRRAASYYGNYRYTWLEVLAVKAGVGVKCRDLMTGEELFLMERSFSQGDVKGMTVCAGIAPMEDVYLALGVIAPAGFDNPAAILKIVLSGLGLPTEIPVRLSFSDQARFAAETIRRIHATGRLGSVMFA